MFFARPAWPGVVEAANLIGSTRCRGRASLAGNAGGDSVPALIAARATCVVAGPKGRREVPVESIATGPGRTSLSAGEFILEFRLPKRPPRSSHASHPYWHRAVNFTAPMHIQAFTCWRQPVQTTLE
jgi:CO/xanthine dehydrogenase FAD-binding subunit